MSYAPATLLAARTFFIDTLAKAGYKINPLSVGIVGDDAHAHAGTSYHLGKDALTTSAYSIVESSRDRAGLSDAAAALDLGYFEITVKGKKHTLRTFNVWLVAQCKANTADTADIREVIYSLDGKTVKRWDRLGKRSTGDSSHLSHTHESWFRDSEKRDKTAHLRRYFTEIGVLAPAPTRKITMELFNAELPVIKYGDNDAKLPGYNMVTRAQLMLDYLVAEKVDADGIYGAQTAAAVKKIMKSGDGKTLDFKVWSALYGLVAPTKTGQR